MNDVYIIWKNRQGGVLPLRFSFPPEGHGVYRYQFTLYALSQELQLPENPSSALVGYMVKAHALAASQIEALYQRH